MFLHNVLNLLPLNYQSSLGF